MKYLIIVSIITILLFIFMSCSGGGGGITPIPTIDNPTTFPTFPTFSTTSTTTTNTTNTWTTTTTSNQNQRYLNVKVLRKTSNNNIQWLGYGWNDYAYVYFRAYNPNNNKEVYVNDGYYGTQTAFRYDTYEVDYVDIGIYRYYLGYDYEVRIGDFYESSSPVWYGRFTVDYYTPYSNSIYIVFHPGVTTNILRNQRKPRTITQKGN
ncbi:MAG: hypothetical protein N2657_03720 [bacterium]|nr:hypothetical protein [bacterium]